MDRAEIERAARTVAEWIAQDVTEHGPRGALRRVILRWFPDSDALALTVHVLAVADPAPSRELMWLPVEWPNLPRESARTHRLRRAHEFGELEARLTAATDDLYDLSADLAEAAIGELLSALKAAGIELADDFAATATHFEAWGGLDVLCATMPEGVVAQLKAERALPPP